MFVKKSGSLLGPSEPVHGCNGTVLAFIYIFGLKLCVYTIVTAVLLEGPGTNCNPMLQNPVYPNLVLCPPEDGHFFGRNT